MITKKLNFHKWNQGEIWFVFINQKNFIITMWQFEDVYSKYVADAGEWSLDWNKKNSRNNIKNFLNLNKVESDSLQYPLSWINSFFNLEPFRFPSPQHCLGCCFVSCGNNIMVCETPADFTCIQMFH